MHSYLKNIYHLSKKKKPLPGVYIFTFHQVSNYICGIIDSGTNSTVRQFEQKIELINENFKIISLNDFLKFRNRSLKEPYAIITFDDGDKSCENFVLPFLKKKELPATFFINSNNILSKELSWPFKLRLLKNEFKDIYLDLIKCKDFQTIRVTDDNESYNHCVSKLDLILNEKKIDTSEFFVSKDFLEKLDKSQFSIGNHGHKHDRYSMLSKEKQNIDYFTCKDFLTSYDSYINVFACPFGRQIDYNNYTLDLCRDDNALMLLSSGGINNFYFNNTANRIPFDNMNYEICSFKYF